MSTQKEIPNALRLAEWIESDMSCQGDAERCLELYEEAAKYEGEWPEETDSVVWGKILAKAVCVRTKTRDWQYKLKEME